MKSRIGKNTTKNVLIVDDDQATRTNLSLLFEEEGFRVILAEDGLAGIIKACEALPDVIVCDIMLPKLNGYSLLAALQLTESTGLIPVIILSAKQDEFDIAQSKLMGAVAYITKPYHGSDLIRSVKCHLTTADKSV